MCGQVGVTFLAQAGDHRQYVSSKNMRVLPTMEVMEHQDNPTVPSRSQACVDNTTSLLTEGLAEGLLLRSSHVGGPHARRVVTCCADESVLGDVIREADAKGSNASLRVCDSAYATLAYNGTHSHSMLDKHGGAVIRSFIFSPARHLGDQEMCISDDDHIVTMKDEPQFVFSPPACGTDASLQLHEQSKVPSATLRGPPVCNRAHENKHAESFSENPGLLAGNIAMACDNLGAPMPMSQGCDGFDMSLFAKPGEWRCDCCMVRNPATVDQCVACEACRYVMSK